MSQKKTKIKNKNKKKEEQQSFGGSDSTYKYYAYHNISDIDLLLKIKHRVIEAVKLGSNVSDLDDIWEKEYDVLQTRLRRGQVSHGISRPSRKPQTIKREKTFLSLKLMSQATDVDDSTHDVAVFLLDNFFDDGTQNQDSGKPSTNDALNIYVCLYICVYLCICVYMCVCVCALFFIKNTHTQ